MTSPKSSSGTQYAAARTLVRSRITRISSSSWAGPGSPRRWRADPGSGVSFMTASGVSGVHCFVVLADKRRECCYLGGQRSATGAGDAHPGPGAAALVAALDPDQARVLEHGEVRREVP